MFLSQVVDMEVAINITPEDLEVKKQVCFYKINYCKNMQEMLEYFTVFLSFKSATLML